MLRSSALLAGPIDLLTAPDGPAVVVRGVDLLVACRLERESDSETKPPTFHQTRGGSALSRRDICDRASGAQLRNPLMLPARPPRWTVATG